MDPMDGLSMHVPILWDLPRVIRARGVAVEDTQAGTLRAGPFSV